MGFNKTAKVISLLIPVVALVLALELFAMLRRQPGQLGEPNRTALQNLPAGWTSYTDPDFHLSFGYPASWTHGGIEELPGGPRTSRTVGFSNASSTGFFSENNSLFLARSTIDDVVNNVLNYEPYGTNPIIQHVTVAGQDARLIWPSSDAKSRPDQLTLYLKCPSGGVFYMEADKEHMPLIIQTMRFQ
jgi:hypothetical protein